MPKQRFYAVAQGRVPGIYMSPKQCEAQVKGFKHARSRKFRTLHEATEFIGISSSSSSGAGWPAITPTSTGPAEVTIADSKGPLVPKPKKQPKKKTQQKHVDELMKENGKLQKIMQVSETAASQRIQRLKEENESLQKQVQEVEKAQQKRVDELMEENGKLQKRMQESETAASERIQKLEEGNESLQKQVQEVETRYEKEKEERQELKAMFEELKRKSELELLDAKRDIASLKYYNAALQLGRDIHDGLSDSKRRIEEDTLSLSTTAPKTKKARIT